MQKFENMRTRGTIDVELGTIVDGINNEQYKRICEFFVEIYFTV